MKPFTFERFVQAVDRAVENLQPKKQIVKTPNNFIFVKTENRLEKVFLREIVFIEGMRHYRRIHIVNKRIMTRQTMFGGICFSNSAKVSRVHKSYMVALAQIESIEKSGIKIKDQIIPLSETYN